ncbi:hypothetical protein [Haloarcula sp. JP-L23]|uniref:hypothetical protein n=1 Tax=Haloarcula sp. JP-L23 TaxID=2716717 RepID=UPI00140EB1E9|nr:hypothetical protein G9465_12270 [Haloarcula sp. JP-L23]
MSENQMRRPLTKLADAVFGALESTVMGYECPECGERSHMDDYEREVFGTGLDLWRCPECQELIA